MLEGKGGKQTTWYNIKVRLEETGSIAQPESQGSRCGGLEMREMVLDQVGINQEAKGQSAALTIVILSLIMARSSWTTTWSC